VFAVAQTGSKDTIHALDHLRAQIAKIENRSPDLNSDIPAAAWTSGHPAMDAALSGIGFGALHEIMADTPAHLPVASAFALGLIARLPRRGPLLWCTTGLAQNEHGALYAPGLAAFGIDPARIVNVNIRHPRDLSFVLEEAARLSSLAAIIAEGPLPSFTASRRLALLLASSGVPLLFLPDGKTVQGSAAVTRLLVSPLTAPDHALDIRAPGPPAFRVTLARHRGGRPGLSFETVFDHANLTFTPLAFTPLSGDQPDGFPDRQFSMASAPERQRSA
jgi:protein ImuA